MRQYATLFYHKINLRDNTRQNFTKKLIYATIRDIILGVIQKIRYPLISVMTNSAFQGGDALLNILSALAIHLLKYAAKAK